MLSPIGFSNFNRENMSPAQRILELKKGSLFPHGALDNSFNDRLDEAIDETEKNRSPKSLYQRTEDFLRAV